MDPITFYNSGRHMHIHDIDVGRVFSIEHVLRSRSDELFPSCWLLLNPTKGSGKIVTRITADLISERIINRVNKYKIPTKIILRGVSWFGAPLLEFIEEGWSLC
jgi:hypothetical protein